MKSIAIVIVNYNTREVLRRCLASIDEDEGIEIIVVDNASTDGSAEMVRSSFPAVTLRARSLNIGYGAAANEAIMLCQADAVLLLNSDVLLQSGSAQRLLEYLDCHPKAAIAGPRLLNGDGSLQPSCYPDPTPFNIFLEESSLGRLIHYLPGLRNLYLRTWHHDSARVVPWLLGAALAIRRDAFVTVKGFDERFFMYFEEVDLCRRLRAAGWQTEFAPVTSLVHYGGVSTKQRYAEMQRRLYTSLQLFYQQHYSKNQLRLLSLTMILIGCARLVRDLLGYLCQPTGEARRELLASIKVQYHLLRQFILPLTWIRLSKNSHKIEEGSY